MTLTEQLIKTPKRVVTANLQQQHVDSIEKSDNHNLQNRVKIHLKQTNQNLALIIYVEPCLHAHYYSLAETINKSEECATLSCQIFGGPISQLKLRSLSIYFILLSNVDYSLSKSKQGESQEKGESACQKQSNLANMRHSSSLILFILKRLKFIERFDLFYLNSVQFQRGSAYRHSSPPIIKKSVRIIQNNTYLLPIPEHLYNDQIMIKQVHLKTNRPTLYLKCLRDYSIYWVQMLDQNKLSLG